MMTRGFVLIALLMGTTMAADAPKKDLSKGGTVLLLGDSIFDCHDGDKRLEVVLKGVLESPERSGQFSTPLAAVNTSDLKKAKQVAPPVRSSTTTRPAATSTSSKNIPKLTSS